MSEKKQSVSKIEKKKKNKQNFFFTILEKIKNWFALLWTGYTIEVQDRIFMSWKRIIKFSGIALIPIIYGVVCLVAFWNPIAGMGKVPVAIMNSGDQNIILVENTEPQDDSTTLVKIGALVNPDPDFDGANNWDSPDATTYTSGNDLASLTAIIQNLNPGDTYYLNNGLSFTYSATTTQLLPISMWEFMKSMMLPKTDSSIADEDYTFKTRTIFQGMALENIHYISDPQKVDDQWQGSKYYVQANLEKNYTANLFGYLGSIINQNQTSAKMTATASSGPRTPSDWKDILTKMDIWTTFERNFIFGYYMQTFSTFSSGLMLKILPNLISSFGSDLYVSGSEINSRNGTDFPAQFINPQDKYLLLRSGEPNLTNVGMPDELWNEPNLRDLTLFGNIKEDGSIVQTGQVGGKIVNLLEKLKLLNSTGIFDAIPLSSNTRDLLTNIFNVLKVVSSENLSSYIYRGITGQWSALDLDTGSGNPTTPAQFMHGLVLQLLGKIGFQLPDSSIPSTIPAFFKQITILPITDPTYAGKPPVLSQSIFETIFSGFMQENPTVFDGTTKIEDLSSVVINKWLTAIIGSPRINDFVSFTEQGSENGIYGIGLGQFFLVIGIWIGILMHTFVFDRAKRYSKATPSTWYLSKTLLMITVALIQATLEVWIAYLCGWHQIGIEATLFMWLWFMAAAIMFVVLIQGLWFVVKDETIGKFIVIIIMVLSLAAGGGTFPALAQFKFFAVINHIVPFTYVLKGLGAIVYGVGSIGTTASSTAVILKAFGAFFVYIAIFGSLGLFIGSKNRFKEMNYGSHYGKCVTSAMIALKRNSEDINKFRTIKKTTKKGKDRYQYHWDKLEPGLDLELYLKVRAMFPFEGRFKWWERKHHDPVQRPNYSDEDIMSRNE